MDKRFYDEEIQKAMIEKNRDKIKRDFHQWGFSRSTGCTSADFATGRGEVSLQSPTDG
jgi:hypothetical protein